MTDDDTIRFFDPGEAEFSFSIDVEAPPRDVEHLLGGPNTITISGNSGLVDGEYRRCDYCNDDSLVEVDYYETHLAEEHNVEP